MGFSTCQVTHSFLNADGTPASGNVDFTLTKRMTNGTTTLVPAKIVAALDASGHLSQSLTANADTGTVPGDAMWRVDLRLATPGEPLTETYFITVPTGGGTVDLGSLLPQGTPGG